MTFEFLRYDARRRVRGSLVLTAGMTALTAMLLWVYPAFRGAFDEDELLEAYPDALLRVFDIETMTSLEGFLAFELYAFGWVILLGLYFAYSAAGLIADDVEHGRMDTLLAMPVSRARLLVERFAALGVPILVVNLVIPVVILVGARLIDESPSATDLFAVHALSVPYLFACAGIGIVCSVVFDRASVAQRVALGVAFALIMLESVLQGTDYEALGAVAPARYFDQNEVLLESSYDLVGTGTLVAMTLGLLAVSVVWFARKDL